MKTTTKTILVIFLALLSLNNNAISAPPLSENAKYYLITATPGDELYSVFGHSAIWVYDPAFGIDNVYNYGTFNFNTPSFYLKFIRGKLMYMLSVSSVARFMPEYQYFGRGVVQQELNLTMLEKQIIFEFLEENRKPENKEYLYDFFYDNCATRIRDVFDNLVEIEWHDYPFDFEQKTFRQLLEDYVSNMPWERFGIDLVLGAPVDKKATAWEYMFLPDHMYVCFANAKRADGQPLVIREGVMLKKTLVLQKPGFFTPNVVFWSLFVIGFVLMLFQKTRKRFAKTWLFLMGLIGLALLPLFLFSDHITFTPNLNLLWALPLNLIFVFISNVTWGQRYFKLVFFITVLMILFWPIFPQSFNPAVFPILLTIMICSAYLAIRNPNKKFPKIN